MARPGRAAVERGAADPRGLTVVTRQRLARLLREHAAFGDHTQVEALGNAGVEFHAIVQCLEVTHRGAKTRLQSMRLLLHRLQPGALQRRHQLAVAEHRAEHRHALLCGVDAHLGRAECAEYPQRWQRLQHLRHVHLRNRLCRIGRPGTQALQQLHTAQRQRQGARVGAHVLRRITLVEQAHARMRQHTRGVQRQRQAYRAGADDRDVDGRGIHALQPSRNSTAGTSPPRSVTMRPLSLLSMTSANFRFGEYTVSISPPAKYTWGATLKRWP